MMMFPTPLLARGAAKPKLTLSAATLPENAAINTVIGTLSVERAPVGVTYTYALISNPGNRFNILGASLRSSAVLDFETAASHPVTIRATGSDASVIDQAFVIAVADIASSPIVITFPTPVEVADDALAGEVVTTLSATSADTSDTFVFSLVAASPNFEVVGNQLRVKLGASLVEGASHALTIRATAPGGAFADAPLAVAVVAGGVDVADVFATTLYLIDQLPKTITNGLDLAAHGGMIMRRARTFADAIHVLDTVRTESGGDPVLYLDRYHGDQGDSIDRIDFNSSGVVLKASYSELYGGSSEVMFGFRRAAGFFDIVKWTGDGVAGRVITHSLGAVPGAMLVMRRQNGGAYRPWVNIASWPQITDFRSNAPSENRTITLFDGFKPTETHFKLRGADEVNATGVTYIAYIWGDDANGVVRAGQCQVVGGGATVTLGWRPQFLMARRIDATASRIIVDGRRGWSYGAASRVLVPEASTAESIADVGYPTTTGFRLNGADGTYEFFAIRATS